MNRTASPSSTRGFGLVELMIALLIGSLVSIAAISIFLAVKQTYRFNQAVSEVQDGTRVAFEYLSRDLRQAGLSGCDMSEPIANVLNTGPNNGGTAWYANWANALHGYNGQTADPAIATGTGVGQRVAGTDSLEIFTLPDAGVSVAQDTNNGSTSAQFKLNQDSNLAPGDLAMVCDYDHGAIFQVTGPHSDNRTVVHNTGTGTPGNCSKGLGYPSVCTTNGNSYTFSENARIVRLQANVWYLGHNPAQGTSLYRETLVANGGALTPQTYEMVRNVTAWTPLYHLAGQNGFVPAGNVTDWTQVDAVRLQLTVQSTDATVNQGAPYQRTVQTTVALRNRSS